MGDFTSVSVEDTSTLFLLITALIFLHFCRMRALEGLPIGRWGEVVCQRRCG